MFSGGKQIEAVLAPEVGRGARIGSAGDRIVGGDQVDRPAVADGWGMNDRGADRGEVRGVRKEMADGAVRIRMDARRRPLLAHETFDEAAQPMMAGPAQRQRRVPGEEQGRQDFTTSNEQHLTQ